MYRKGICYKCGRETTVHDHHAKGYLGDNKDFVLPYCTPCDQEAHRKAKEDGKCRLSDYELKRLTQSSCVRRSYRTINLSGENIGEGIKFMETLRINNNTGEVVYKANFYGAGLKTIFI